MGKTKVNFNEFMSLAGAKPVGKRERDFKGGRALPVTDEQKNSLHRFGIGFTSMMWRGQASDVIDVAIKRAEKHLATAAQMRTLSRMGISDVNKRTFEEASDIISKKKAGKYDRFTVVKEENLPKLTKAEFCFLDKDGIHNKVYNDNDDAILKHDVETVSRLRPNAPKRLLVLYADTSKPHCKTSGDFNWSDTDLIVEAKLFDENHEPIHDENGNQIQLTYITKKYVGISEEFTVNTTRGKRIVVISSPCMRKTNTDILNIASFIGYSRLVVLQDVVVE